MYTECPHCSAIFRVTATQLSSANGQVRCGLCGGLFNALHALHDGPGSTEHDDADELPKAAGDDLEFDLHEDEWDEIFEEPDPGSDGTGDAGADDLLRGAAEEALAAGVLGAETAESVVLEGDEVEVGDRSLEFDVPPEQWATVFSEATSEADKMAGPEELDESARDNAEELLLEELSGRRSGRIRLWSAGSVALLALLLVQFIDYQRAAFRKYPVFGPALEAMYSILGADDAPITDLNLYGLTQRGATADPEAGGTLTVHALVANNAPVPQPFPLLRLLLEDRWGHRVGARNFEPADYLPDKTLSSRSMASGETVEARIVIVDPGADAWGFAIDVCMRDPQAAVTCAGTE